MAFWGASIPGNGSYTLLPQDPPRRLRITQASNFTSNSDFLRLEVKVGENQPIPVAIGKGLTKLELEFEEPNDVVLSVVGPTEVHLVGCYYMTNQCQDCYPTQKIGSKNGTSIYPESDVELNRGKSTEKVADMECMECNILEERLVSNEHTPKINIQVETLGNQLSEQQSEPREIDVIDQHLISDPEPGVIVGHDDEHNVADVDSMECNVLEEKLDSNEQTSMVNIQGDTLVNEPQKQQSEPRDIDAIVTPLISIPEPCVIVGHDDERKGTDSSDFSMNAQEKEEVVMERKRHKKRKLVPEEKIQEDPIPIEPGDDGTQQVKRKEKKKKKIRKMISGKAEDIVEDSRNKKKSDLVPAKENKQAKKDKYIIISREKHELVDTSKMSNDTFEAPPTKVKSAKAKRKKAVTSGVPDEQSKADSAHIVLGLSSSRIAPNKKYVGAIRNVE